MNKIQWTPVVKKLVILNVIIFALWRIIYRLKEPSLFFLLEDYSALYKTNLLGLFGADFDFRFNPIQLITHFFSHFDPIHILFNMFALISLGPPIEKVLGSRRFLRFYLFCGVVGGIILAIFDPNQAPVIGASGAIFGVMAFFAEYFPDNKLSVLNSPPISAKKLMLIVVTGSVLLVILEILSKEVRIFHGFDGGGISHFGHIAGVIAAAIYYYVEKYLPTPNK
ncbi:MAG: rhomboid family intramembrane serine protease [Bacteroidota bacterium]